MTAEFVQAKVKSKTQKIFLTSYCGQLCLFKPKNKTFALSSIKLLPSLEYHVMRRTTKA